VRSEGVCTCFLAQDGRPGVAYLSPRLLLFFFPDTATTEIYTLSLHDALPISSCTSRSRYRRRARRWTPSSRPASISTADRKSTRLNSSHANISYAVFCLT